MISHIILARHGFARRMRVNDGQHFTTQLSAPFLGTEHTAGFGLESGWALQLIDERNVLKNQSIFPDEHAYTFVRQICSGVGKHLFVNRCWKLQAHHHKIRCASSFVAS